MKFLHFAFILLFFACTKDDAYQQFIQQPHIEGEYITRSEHISHDLLNFTVKKKTIPPYPWQKSINEKIAPITKEFFRCKGSSLHPPLKKIGSQQTEWLEDCDGAIRHSLPYRNDQEFIFPILLELLNEIQNQTQKKVIITSGHRCPTHNTYVDPSPQNAPSKHTIGAEVDFYVKELESQPQEILEIIFSLYAKHSRYAEKKEYTQFTRFDKPTNTRTKPWYNKEIFIKLFMPDEGRNFDNRHPFPYISIQVRYDIERELPVTYSWQLAQQYLRY